jgi:hypothetical protein
MEIENTPEVEVEPVVETEDVEASEGQEVAEEVKEETEDSPEADGTESEEKLILGKYKTLEELEKAHLSLQGEYTKRTQLEKDPNYVYELAKKAGLTDAEAQAEANAVDPNQIGQLVNQKVQEGLAVAKDYDKALAILPELGKDAKLEAWGRALVEMGMTHEQAAKTIKSKLSEATESARVEGAKSKEAEISEKEAAQTSPTIGNVDSDTQEMESLKEKAKSLNRQEQDSALAELLAKSL